MNSPVLQSDYYSTDRQIETVVQMEDLQSEEIKLLNGFVLWYESRRNECEFVRNHKLNF